ncbi:MAG: hypothetical protein HQL40_13085 [Alphaproteobacteria bacterium]|nr:hypothetical protein [Alphaproteobacteria bacterium]
MPKAAHEDTRPAAAGQSLPQITFFSHGNEPDSTLTDAACLLSFAGECLDAHRGEGIDFSEYAARGLSVLLHGVGQALRDAAPYAHAGFLAMRGEVPTFKPATSPDQMFVHRPAPPAQDEGRMPDLTETDEPAMSGRRARV